MQFIPSDFIEKLSAVMCVLDSLQKHLFSSLFQVSNGYRLSPNLVNKRLQLDNMNYLHFLPNVTISHSNSSINCPLIFWYLLVICFAYFV